MGKLGTVKYYKKKADTLVSKIVRTRGKCEWCGGTSHLQAAHFVGRQNHTLRFDLQNVLCFCAGCHRKAHDYPKKFVDWFTKKFPNRLIYIELNQNQLTKRTALDYKELVGTLQEKLDEK